MKRKLFIYALFVSALGMGAISCNDDDPNPNLYVNNWIQRNMETYYYWNTELPSSPNKNQKPDDFFYSLLSNEDRFSWIQENFEELLNSLQGVNKEAGYEFLLFRESNANENVIAQVAYIKTGSPAASKDLLRGDIITHINGTQMTLSNYQSLLGQISENHTIRYQRFNPATEVFEDKGTLSLTVVEFAENPNFYHNVYEVSGRKIGYYVYHFFAEGPDQVSKAYDDEMDNIFADFKAQGITDLIIDLRYNSGGSESSATNLASLIAPGVTTDDVLSKKQYNAIVTESILDDPDLGPDFLVTKFLSKTQNVGNQLGGRVYILTGGRTASASELIINGLKPYMDVFIIGDVTVGKNVGSISIYEEDDPKNTWGMQPIVVKIFNSLDESDYSNGFTPNILNEDNEPYLLPFGDLNENLLNVAIGEITGTGSAGKKYLTIRPWGKMLGSSLDAKRKNMNIQLDKKRNQVLIENLLEKHLPTP